MRCTECGSEFRSREEHLETTTSEQIGLASVAGARTETRLVVLCPACTRLRNKTERMFALVFIAGLMVLVAAAFLGWVFG
jgi:hypothetical protein